MSDNFPNISSNGGDMGFTVKDPNNTAIDMDEASNMSMGKTKISPTDMSGPSSQVAGYGYMSSDLKNVGMAPSGENSSGIPAAQPINPLTFGDPNDTGMDFKDGSGINTYSLTGKDYEKHGFDTAI